MNDPKFPNTNQIQVLTTTNIFGETITLVEIDTNEFASFDTNLQCNVCNVMAETFGGWTFANFARYSSPYYQLSTEQQSSQLAVGFF